MKSGLIETGQNRVDVGERTFLRYDPRLTDRRSSSGEADLLDAAVPFKIRWDLLWVQL